MNMREALEGYLSDCTSEECERCIAARAALAALPAVPEGMDALRDLAREAADMLADMYPGYVSHSGPYSDGIQERDQLVAKLRAMIDASKGEGL